MDAKPVAAFYCCYLLRSTVRHASLYIGSTPNPARRLAQHNGTTKGGATRTARNSLRPWEMACIVTGFPTNIAALQFEWAWQNAHLTRRIAESNRISTAVIRSRVNPNTGTVRHRRARPGMSLADRLANLYLLMTSPSFARWPLELRFFAADVHRAWLRRCSEFDDGQKPDFNVILDQAASQSASLEVQDSGQGLTAIDSSYAPLKDHVEKSAFLLAEGEEISCPICKESVYGAQSILTCPKPECRAASHLTCLSTHFLRAEDTQDLVPKKGQCPSCAADLIWLDLVREMTLRTRGKSDLNKLLKKRKTRKKAAQGFASPSIGGASNSSDEELVSDADNLDQADQPVEQLAGSSTLVPGGDDQVIEDTEAESIIVLD